MPPFPLSELLVRGGGVNVARGRWARGRGRGWGGVGGGLDRNLEQKRGMDGEMDGEHRGNYGRLRA